MPTTVPSFTQHKYSYTIQAYKTVIQHQQLHNTEIVNQQSYMNAKHSYTTVLVIQLNYAIPFKLYICITQLYNSPSHKTESCNTVQVIYQHHTLASQVGSGG